MSDQGAEAWERFFQELALGDTQDRFDGLVTDFFPTFSAPTPEPFLRMLIAVMRASFLSGYGMAVTAAESAVAMDLIARWSEDITTELADEED